LVGYPNLSDEVNRNIRQSEMDGGVFLDKLKVGAVLHVRTQYRIYRVENCAGDQFLISGHPLFCPGPVLVEVVGSSWAGSLVKPRFIGRGMHLEFRHPFFGVILTSRIEEIQQ
jgi:hypothetical protein